MVALPLSLLLLLLQSPLSQSQATTYTTDQLALLAFKSLLRTAAAKTNLSSWNPTTPVCRWQGVSCEDPDRPGRITHRVTHLNLSSSGLSGSISPSLSNLTFLSYLNLSFNSLTGPIPPELGLLPRLRYLNLRSNSLDGPIPTGLTRSCPDLFLLYLDGNMLQGTIPANLSRCGNLVYLDLRHNSLSGTIPTELGTFPALEQLLLNDNHLTGTIPPSLGNISTLTKLSLSSNNFQGRIPPDLGHLQGLYVLDLVFNRFSGEIPPAIFNISSLYGLGLGNNSFSGRLPPDFGANLPSLEYVYLYNNQLEGPIPASIANATSLKLFQLSNNKFSGLVPGNLGSLSQLTRLQLGTNRFEAARPEDWSFVASLANCTELVELDLWNNSFSGSLPESFGNLSGKLSRLILGHNQITGNLSVIGNLRSLNEFDVEKGLFSGPIPDTFGKLTNLRLLSLSKNRLSGAIPPSIGNLTQLLDLRLNENRLSGFIPESFASLQKLIVLDLSYNNLTGNVPAALIGLSSLSLFLNLSHNSLEGPLPNVFQKLVNLKALDFSGNKFSGGIPSSLGDCVVLEYLNMGDNEFSGTIPDSVGNLKGIQVLNFSLNHLSGSIPTFLGRSFPVLQFLNLSFNDFEGDVPTGGLFMNSSLFSVLGNRRLCGGISELHLQSCSRKKHGLKTPFIVIIVVGILFALIISFFIFYKYFWSRRLKEATESHDPEAELLWKVSYAELVTATDGFSPANLIGQGGFGMVYRGILKQEQSEVAIKVLNQNMIGVSKSFMVECNALKNIRHRNLVKIITSCSTTDHTGQEFKALIYEYMPNGSLEAWLHSDVIVGSKPRYLKIFQRLRIARDIALALDYLHNDTYEPIVHCDLKPSNILLRDDMTACIGDFGIARILSTNVELTSGIKGSIGYIAPECGMGGPISPLWDVYSFGILLLEMFTGRRPTDENFVGGLNLHEFVRTSFPENIMEVVDPNLLLDTNDDQMKKTIRECLEDVMELALICSKKLPSERMSMDNVSKRFDIIVDVFSALERVRK